MPEVAERKEKKETDKRNMIVKSAVKEFLQKRDLEFNVGSDFYGAMADKVELAILRAAHRAKENGRKTLKAYDL